MRSLSKRLASAPALPVASFGVALLGQSFLNGFPLALVSSSSLGTGVICLGVAVALAAFAPISFPARAIRGTLPPAAVGGRLRLLAVSLGAAAAALYAIAGENVAVRLLWAGGFLVFAAAVWPDRGENDEPPGPPAAWDAAFLFVIAAAGFALRYTRIMDLPSELDGDFASAGLEVVRLQGNPSLVGVGDTNVTLVFYQMLKLCTSLFGLDMHGLMAGSALLGTLCIGAVYFLGREVGSRPVGLIAAALLATGVTAIHFSRVVLTPSAMLAVTLMVVFLLRALRTGGERWFALAGVAGAVASLMYFAGRVAPVIAGVLMLADLGRSRTDWRRKLRGWRTLALAAALTVGPMLVFYARHPAALVARGADVTIFSPRNQAHLLGSYHVETMGQMLLEQVKRTFLTFHLFGDTSSEFGYPRPLLNPLTAAFLVVGLGLALRRFRSPAVWALLSWLLLVFSLGGVLTLDPPDWVHLVVALPAAVVLAAWGAEQFFEGLVRIRARVLPTALALAAVAAAAIPDWQQYVDFVGDNAGLNCAVARWASGLPAGTRVLAVEGPLSWGDRVFRFYNRGVDGRGVSAREIEELSSVEKPTAIVLTRDHAARLLFSLVRRFPSAEAFAHYNHGWLHFYSLHVAPAEARAGPVAAPYRSLGRTSPLGWSFGLLAAALAAAAPWLARGPDASRRGGSAPAEREPPPRARAIDEAGPAPAVMPARPAVMPARPAVEPADVPAPPPRLVFATAVPLADAGIRHPALLVAGFLLAVIAQALFDAQRPEGIAVWKALLAPVPESTRVAWGSALLLAAVALWIGALRPVRPLHVPVAPLVWPRSLTLLLLPALGCAGFALVRFARRQEDGAVRAAWVASIVLFLAGPAIEAWRARRTPGEVRTRRFDWRALLVLVAILIAAAYLRFESLGHLPDDFHGDMSSYGHTARAYLSGEESRIFGVEWAEIPRIGYLPTVLAMKIAGNDVRGLMTAAAVGGLLSLLALYGLVRVLFQSEGLALLATAVSAGNAAHIHFSRIAAYMDPWPFCLGALFFLFDGLRRRRLPSFAAAGVFLGFGLQMYYSGRVIPLVLAAFVGWALVFRHDWVRGSAAGWALLGAGVLVTAGPNVLFFLQNFQALNARGREVWLFSPDVLTHLSGVYHVSSPVLILLRQIVRSLLLFNHTIDTSTQFGYTHAMISPLIAPFVVLGFAVALRRWREPGPALALSFWALTLALGGFLTVDAPFWPRLVGILAPASIFAGLALQTLAAFFASRVPRLGLAIPAAVAALLLWAAVSSYAVYRRDMSQNARTYAYIGRFLDTLPRDATACAAQAAFEMRMRELTFLAWPRRTVGVKAAETGAPPTACATPPFTWILPPGDASTRARLKERWPNGVLEEHRTRGRELVFESFSVMGGSPAGALPQ